MLIRALMVVAVLLANPFFHIIIPDAKPAALKGVVFFQGDVDDSTMQGIKNDLGATGGDDIVLVISSPGGNVFAGLNFIQDVERMKAAKPALKIHCVGDIIVASMAADIFESDVCDTRQVTNRTVVLFHGVQAPDSPLKTAIDFAIAQWVAPRLLLTPGDFLAKVRQGDWIMNAYEAVAAHAADEIITHVSPP